MRGPKGSGALFIRDGVRLAPLIRGGGHERGLRGGTENVAGIVGLGCAAAIAHRELAASMRHSGDLRDRFELRLAASIRGVTIHGNGAARLSNTSCLSIADVPGHALMMWLDERNIAVSTGAACHAGSDEGSAILMSMGVSAALARGALRVSFGPSSTVDEVDAVVIAITEGVERLRAGPPRGEAS
jgi:cysteine desulfurase